MPIAPYMHKTELSEPQCQQCRCVYVYTHLQVHTHTQMRCVCPCRLESFEQGGEPGLGGQGGQSRLGATTEGCRLGLILRKESLWQEEPTAGTGGVIRGWVWRRFPPRATKTHRKEENLRSGPHKMWVSSGDSFGGHKGKGNDP